MTHRLHRRFALVAGLIALAALIAPRSLSAQAVIAPYVLGGGGTQISGSYGSFVATAGEPVSIDSITGERDEVTWIGFWRVIGSDPTLGVHEEMEPVIGYDIGIVAASPNPFTTEIAIDVAIERPAMVRLALYDIAGREIERLVEGRREGGTLHVRWRPEGLESGSYVLRLSIDGHEQRARIVQYYK